MTGEACQRDLAGFCVFAFPFNWAWPMLEVEPLTPPVPTRGAQGFWEWRP
jgi:hypothetical protein